MTDLRRSFQTRAREVRHYLKMLRALEQQPTFLSLHQASLAVDTNLLAMLKANVFLILYNLVESTIAGCLVTLGESIKSTDTKYAALRGELKTAWVSEFAKTADQLNPENRLKLSIRLCEYIADELAIDFTPAAPSGNLDDRRIEELAKRLGIQLSIRAHTKKAVKREVINDRGALALIRIKRNNLAHGLESFADSGRDRTVRELRAWAVLTIYYLKDVIDSVDQFIATKAFLQAS